jgi:hypothetical protein
MGRLQGKRVGGSAYDEGRMLSTRHNSPEASGVGSLFPPEGLYDSGYLVGHGRNRLWSTELGAQARYFSPR